MMLLFWFACGVATWMLTRNPELYPYALISAFLCGVCIAVAACEKEMQRLKDSERRAWRYLSGMKSEANLNQEEKKEGT